MVHDGPSGGDELSRAFTRTDVARRAGVSVAVVSYVLNGGPRPVAEATRQRVQQVIDELGYRPNANARALKLARTRTLGLIVRDNANPFFAEFARHVEDESFTRHHALLLGDSSEDPRREAACVDSFLDRSVDGIMVIGLAAAASLRDVTARGTPVVVLDKMSEPDLQVATVYVDNHDGARVATEHLVGHGHRRIGCISGPLGIPAADDRIAGWQAGLSAAGLAHPRTLSARADFSRNGGYQAATRLITRRPHPTALFVGSDIQAAGALRALRDANLRVPEDVAIVAFDGTDGSSFTNPPLSVVQQPFAEMARTAVSLLLDNRGAGTHVLPVRLIPRRSCGCDHPDGSPEAA